MTQTIPPSFTMPIRPLIILASLLWGTSLSTLAAAEPPPPVQAPPSNNAFEDEEEEEVVMLSEFSVSAGSVKDDYVASESVTATRVGMKVLDTPFSVEVLTYEFLNDFQLDAGNEQLAMVSSSGGVLSGFAARLRGFSRRLLVDGINSQFALYPLPAIMVRQVEVVKGPQSANYGDSSPGGIINHVSKRPSTRPSFEYRSYAGTRDNYRAGATISGPLPILTDEDGRNKLFYRAWAEVSHAPTNTIGSSNRIQSYGVSAMLTPNDNTAVTFTTSYRRLERRGYQGENRVRLTANETVGSDRYIPNWEGIGRTLTSSKSSRLIEEHLNFSLLWEQKLSSETSFQVRLNYLDFNQDVNSWKGGTYYYAEQGWLSRRHPYISDDERNVFTVKSDLTHKFRTPGFSHRLLVGVDFTKRDEKSRELKMSNQQADMLWPWLNKSDPVPQWHYMPDVTYDVNLVNEGTAMASRNETDVGALATLMSSTLKGRLKTYLSGRYQYYSIDNGFYSQDSAGAPFGINRYGNGSDSVATYLLGFDYHLVREKLVFYANVASGSDLTSVEADRGIGTIMEPPESKSYEAGFKGENILGKINYTLAFYHTTENTFFTNELFTTSHIGAGTVPEYISGGRMKSEGVELNASMKFSKALTVQFNLGYIDNEILSHSNPLAIGRPNTGMPKRTASFVVKWKPIKTITIGINGAWQDKLNALQPATAYPEGKMLPSVFVANAFANYQINRRKQGGYLHTIGFYIKNALNRDYYTYEGRQYLGREFRLVYNVKS